MVKTINLFYSVYACQIKVIQMHKPLVKLSSSMRLCATFSSPAFLRASARFSVVGCLCFGGAHFNHWLSISRRKLHGPPGMRRGMLSIVFSSPSRKPKKIPIVYHLNATHSIAFRMCLRSISVRGVPSVPVRKEYS